MDLIFRPGLGLRGWDSVCRGRPMGCAGFKQLEVYVERFSKTARRPGKVKFIQSIQRMNQGGLRR